MIAEKIGRGIAKIALFFVSILELIARVVFPVLRAAWYAFDVIACATTMAYVYKGSLFALNYFLPIGIFDPLGVSLIAVAATVWAFFGLITFPFDSFLTKKEVKVKR